MLQTSASPHRIAGQSDISRKAFREVGGQSSSRTVVSGGGPLEPGQLQGRRNGHAGKRTEGIFFHSLNEL